MKAAGTTPRTSLDRRLPDEDSKDQCCRRMPPARTSGCPPMTAEAQALGGPSATSPSGRLRAPRPPKAPPLLRGSRRPVPTPAALLRHLPDVVAQLRVDGTIRFLSTAAARMFGVDPAELVGRPMTELVHPG